MYKLIRRRQRDERGAFAVMYALMLVMLVSIAALGMDLGNAVSRKTDTQNQADFAAFDVGQKFALDIASGSGTLTAASPIVQDVANSMNNNQPQDDDSACWRDNTCISPDQLVDKDLTNGEVRYTSEGLQVVAPLARVNFGFANVFGSSGTSVQSAATVNVFSAGPRVLPMFAVTGCDWGIQTLTSPANAEEIIPELKFSGDKGSARPVLLDIVKSTGGSVQTLDVGDETTYFLKLSADTQWSKTWKIGFFPEGGGDPIIVSGAQFLDPGDHTKSVTSPLDTNKGFVDVQVPSQVTANEGVWWIRAFGGNSPADAAANKWSEIDPSGPYKAPSIQVGTPVLECDAGPSDGNFGTILVPQDIPYNADDLPMNIAYGLKDPLNLVVHKAATAEGTCSEGVNGAVTSDSALTPNTNCVDTDTGLPANVATQGLVTLDDGKGLLANKPTADGCDPNGGSAMRFLDMSPKDYYINNDTLSCFLLPGKTLTEVVQDDYDGGPAFSADLLKSPRFAWVPVFNVRPTMGGSQHYSIVDFRPAFITDENPNPASCADQTTYCVTSDNGLRVEPSGITKIKVVFFHWKALPREGDLELVDYLGVGDPIVHLID